MSAVLKSIAAATDFPQAKLLRGAALGHFDLLGIDEPATRLAPDFLKSIRSPALAVIAVNVGPGRVASAKMLRGWARVGLIHAVVEREREYNTISSLIGAYQRVLLIETMPPLAMMWLTFLRERLPTTGWVPGPGGLL